MSVLDLFSVPTPDEDTDNSGSSQSSRELFDYDSESSLSQDSNEMQLDVYDDTIYLDEEDEVVEEEAEEVEGGDTAALLSALGARYFSPSVASTTAGSTTATTTATTTTTPSPTVSAIKHARVERQIKNFLGMEMLALRRVESDRLL